VAPALWWAVLTALSPHYAWIYGAVVLVSFVVGREYATSCYKPRPVASYQEGRHVVWTEADKHAIDVTLV
jgi:hypothetical protein